MAIVILDVASETDVDSFEQSHDLDGRSYVLRFDWNTRDESWNMNVSLPDGTLLAASRKLVVGVPLLRGLVDARLPVGMLIAADLTDTGADPGHDDLGGRVVLMYLDAEYLATGQ